jgi:hypothetical protein
MNHSHLIKSISLALVSTLFGITSSLQAQSTHSVRVSATLKSDHDDPKGSITEVVKKHLEIEVSGSNAVQGDVKITYTFFADDLAVRKVVVVKSDDIKTTLVAGKRTPLKSPVVTFSFTPEHSVKSGSGKRARYNRVNATGKRYHGWSVQVYSGDRLVGEAYSLPALKTLMNRDR